MMHFYKGYTINKVFRYGYNYYRVSGTRTLYSRLKDAKRAIDLAEAGEEELV